MKQTTQNSKVINATVNSVYEAFTNPESLAIWLAPGNMTGKVKNFDLRVGGGYEMSLFYPASEQAFKGKTSENEDRYTARFVELIPSKKIIQAIHFDSPDPGFSGEMMMEVTFDQTENGTNVTFLFSNIPKGITPEDNKAGTISTLEKLAHFVETGLAT